MSIRGIVTIFLIGIIFCDAAAAFLLRGKSGIISLFLLDFVKNLFIHRKNCTNRNTKIQNASCITEVYVL